MSSYTFLGFLLLHCLYLSPKVADCYQNDELYNVDARNARYKEQAKAEVVTHSAMPFPYPQTSLPLLTYYSLNPNNFKFVVKETKLKDCEILKEAIQRYRKLLFLSDCRMLRGRRVKNSNKHFSDNGVRNDPNYLGELKDLTIEVRSKCESMPHADMDEMYTLRINSPDFPNDTILFANNVWGALRGLESFSQLVYQQNGIFYINSTFILDYPRFNHRGLLLDTSRHYVSVDVLLQNLDAMAYNKLNVFHWHIVDDQSFPFVSKTFPNISKEGAFLDTHIYSPDDVFEVIEYARKLGIRVMVEFDTPGHTQSWGKGQPGLLTECYDKLTNKPNGNYGPIDPTVNENYMFLSKFFKEVAEVFPEQYLHLGGDEVDFSCWESNPKIETFMEKLHFGKDYAKLESYYIQKLIEIAELYNKSYMVWQEVFDNGVDLKKDSVVHVWKDGYKNELHTVTQSGYRAILSTPWYLSNIKFGADWKEYYPEDPTNFGGSEQQKNLVMGGEVCIWGEFVDGTNLISRTWPRSSPVAERFWSPQHVNSVNEAIPRLERQRCLMLQRGIRVEPINGPGFCPCDYAV